MSASRRRLAASLALDVRLQAQSKLYAIGLFAAVLLGLGTRWMLSVSESPEAYMTPALAAFYVLGVGGTTYMFGAATILMEKGEGTLHALRVSPLRQREYVLSKIITLTAFATVESAVIYFIAGGLGVSPLPLLAGVLMLGVLYTLIGLGQSAGHDSMTSFLFPWAVLVSLIIQLPALYIVDIGPPWLWHLIPTQAPILVMLSGAQPLSVGQWIYVALMGIGSITLAALWCRARFRRHLGLTEDR